MPILPAAYAKSKTLYALDPASFTVEASPHQGLLPTWQITVRAIWTVTKAGKAQVSTGCLHTVERQEDGRPTWESFLATFDTRYGGQPDARWDGAYLWAPDTTLAAMNEYAAALDPVLKALPRVPPGHEGWFALTSR